MDPTRRFTQRVDDYELGRPSYPSGVIEHLERAIGLTSSHVVADIGSGTGISSRPFLQHGNVVYGVEPNAAMAEAAERQFANEPRFRSVRAPAEATGLAPHSIDLVVAGQAFHWFQPEPFAVELRRIARPGGWLLLFWNQRRSVGAPFLETYETFLREWGGAEYEKVKERWGDPMGMHVAFGREPPPAVPVPNPQSLDRDGLRARILSCSYIPGAEHPRRAPMLEAIEEMFDAHAHDGRVVLEYDTNLYLAKIEPQGRAP